MEPLQVALQSHRTIMFQTASMYVHTYIPPFDIMKVLLKIPTLNVAVVVKANSWF